ncbi:hypothetical protein C1I99_11685 [Micromonospora deserti]|uniref:PPE family domain-containing protein n=1 Tax=Micromonospora deserti TaxID=2070366 RepID=A0A2W2CMU0_9ACTN|nr:hypothetical protein C1I99_11685 [Micromonospora deserti]
MDVASMWACLQDHDTTNHWKQVAGWRKVCDLAQTHLSRLQEYRRGLAEAWPPETNAAARAYLAELDELIDKVQRTHDAAATNYTALSAATQAIGTTRAELKKIYEEYAVKLQQKQAYEATMADPKAAMGSRVPDRPVTDDDLERLNVQARGIMYGLSGELHHAQVMLRQPPHMKPKVDGSSADYGTASAQAPVIPPVVPVPLATGRNTPSITRSGTTARSVPLPSAPGVGPVLGGTGTGLAPAPTNPKLPGTTPAASPNPSPGLGVPPPSTGISRPGGSGPVRGLPGQVSRSVAGSAGVQPHAPQPAKPRPMPPGGLIGGVPGSGLGQPGAGNTPRRVNPIGGVIGGGGAGTAPSGGAGSRPGGSRGLGFAHGMPPFVGGPWVGAAGSGTADGVSSMQGRRERSAEEPSHWDPNHPWETDKGVPPVVQPPDEEGPIDPGPAIGLKR